MVAFPLVPGDGWRSLLGTGLSMLKWLTQVAFGYAPQKQASCSRCRATYAKAKPFIEGQAGVLICCQCVLAFGEKMRKSTATHAAGSLQLHADPNIGEETNFNPYTPPLAPFTAVKTCAFCEVQSSLYQDFGAQQSLAICDACIAESITLVETELARETQRVGQEPRTNR